MYLLMHVIFIDVSVHSQFPTKICLFSDFFSENMLTGNRQYVHFVHI